MGALVVFTTFPDRESAESILKTLVEERLSACAQIAGEIKSFYWWEGKLEEGKEFLAILKTTEEKYPELERRLVELHPYEVPEVVAVPSAFVYRPYLNWLEKELG